MSSDLRAIAKRNTGSTSASLLVPTAFVLALAGSTCVLTSVAMRSATGSSANLDAWLAANAGAQAANALVRSTGPDLDDQSLTIYTNGREARVHIAREQRGRFRIESESSVARSRSKLSLVVSFEDVDQGPYEAQSAFALTIGQAVSNFRRARVRLDDEAFVSGENHRLDGQVSPKRKLSVAGLGVHESSTGVEFGVRAEESAYVHGIPRDVSSDLEVPFLGLSALTARARARAQVRLKGEVTLGTEDSSRFGGERGFRIVHVKLAEGDTLTLGEHFAGAGLLYVEAEPGASVHVRDHAVWRGLVFVRYGDAQRFEFPAGLELRDHAQIIGAVQVAIDLNAEIAGVGTFLRMSGRSKILFSSHALAPVIPLGVPEARHRDVITWRVR